MNSNWFAMVISFACRFCWTPEVFKIYAFHLPLYIRIEYLDMLNSAKFHNIFENIQLCKKIHEFGPSISMYRCSNFSSSPNQTLENNVAIFWDLDNKPPKSHPPYEAAIKLKKAAQRFGFVKYMIAYANRHSFSYVPPQVKAQRRERKSLNDLETIGVIKPNDPYICRVCGRRFYTNEKLINHFKQIHEREQLKRLNQIESAKGKRRVNMVARYSMKMDKYKNAARDILTPKVGYGLGDELKRAGFWVRTVSDKPQASDVALRHHMVDMMDRRVVECLFVASDDSDFVEVLKEAKLRCLKTVVVGDSNEGLLKRTADMSFSWQDIMMGKARKEAGSVVGKWKDRNVLGKLEWNYDPETEKKFYYSEIESEGSDFEFVGENDSLLETRSDGAWWELERESEDVKRSQE